jgi:hypothetical protein
VTDVTAIDPPIALRDVLALTIAAHGYKHGIYS